ncbi:GntR family transcriptional regulator [Nitratireductor thuwali]|uniref:HTH-type transcriptional regulator McbR n=1 Tax=Nitratireductor thuwali TaxID=2267699 RepID=A0ABY5MCV2_9HYPH|nr:HTH-type transcriptional regulator McbR [Nitratireductor thuwali]
MLDEPLGPVSSRVTIGDGVYFQLRNALITGRFDPGQVLTISALAKSFQTSHMPVREALRRLAAENALEIASNGSACVPKVSVERLDDICRARVALEGLATEIAAGTIRPEEIPAVEAFMAEHEATSAGGNVYDMLLKNRDFHFAIYRASRSEVLVQLIDSLWLRYGPYMRMLSSHIAPRLGTGLHEPFANHHHAIVDALRRRDGAAAREHMVADITGTQMLLRELCQAEAI